MQTEKPHEVAIQSDQMRSISNPQSLQLMQCLASNNEVGLIVFEKNLSISNAIDGTKLKKLENTVGEIATITAICYLLNRFNANFNVGKSLSATQSALIASDIVEKYPYETIEDVVLMLKQVRQGIIGDGRDYKLDGQNILAKWFPEYLDKKYAEVERVNKIAKDEISKAESADDHPITKYYAKIRARKLQEEKEKQIKAKIDEMIKEMDRQMLEDTILGWSKNSEMLPYLDYLKSKRPAVPGKF